MTTASLYHTFHRYRTLQTHRISALPVAILMPHSACNCQCVMCDIWKDNKRTKQLTEKDIRSLLTSFKKLGTQQVVMSGGEALLNPLFFSFCDILKQHHLKITLLSTGLLLERHAENLLRSVDEIIVSLDGDEPLHDHIRNIPGAWRKLAAGIRKLKNSCPGYRITARSVIHQLNFRRWTCIIDSAIQMGIDQISFLAADTTSHAFNRKELWGPEKRQQVLLSEEDLPLMQEVINELVVRYDNQFRSGFIAESPQKIQKIHQHYSAVHGLAMYPYKKCNAPWVSAVVEPDGSVRPCFFHDTIGNIRDQPLTDILNGKNGLAFRKHLDMDHNPVCKQCVCYLNLSPRTNFR